MGRRKLPAERAKRMAKNRERREKESLSMMNKWGVHPSKATPEYMARVNRYEKSRKKQIEAAVKAYEELLVHAKGSAVVNGDFEYCGLTVQDKRHLDVFNKELKEYLKARTENYKGEESWVVMDEFASDFKQGWVDKGLLIACPAMVGNMPRARKYKNGKVEVLRCGEPDADFLRENITGVKWEDKCQKEPKRK